MIRISIRRLLLLLLISMFIVGVGSLLNVYTIMHFDGRVFGVTSVDPFVGTYSWGFGIGLFTARSPLLGHDAPLDYRFSWVLFGISSFLIWLSIFAIDIADQKLFGLRESTENDSSGKKWIRVKKRRCIVSKPDDNNKDEEKIIG